MTPGLKTAALLLSLLSFCSYANTTSTAQQYSRNTPLTQEQLSIAGSWGLNANEWTRYLELKQGERGIWSPNLDPLTTLGIEATTDAERQRYARLLAQKEYQRVEKELAFQLAYDKAFQELYPNEMPFTVEPHASQASGRIFYFTRLENCEKCETDLSRILSYADGRAAIDIYVVGEQKNDEAIRKWAVKHKIDPAKVNQRIITLNHDTGYWLQYAEGKIPAAFQVTGDGVWQKLVY
ncbi:TIGR03759 family integrating conjugative element protein [Pasteurella testudinis]|uniref:TIGR03759 family integrating conjugative element protein n=1 Tax=Pasteurella testudinis TaxID=761 RepID=UPI00405814D5